MLRRLLLSILVVSVAGCSDGDSDTVEVDILNVQSIDAAAFGEAKRIPERARDRREEAYKDFQSRSQIAGYLLKEQFADNPKVRIETQELINNLVLNRYLNERAEQDITEAQIEDYYRAHSDQFSKREYDVAHIFFRLRPDADESTLAAVEEKAQAAHARLRDGEEFSDLVAELSEDAATRDKGGQLPTLTSDNLDPAVDKPLSTLEPGEFTAPVRTDRGLQIFKLDAVKLEPVPLEQVADRIAYILKQEFERKELDRLRVQARSNAD